MFLPIIMLHRYGWAGFLVFAIPNVIGCAAFGYIVRNRQRSIALICRHRWAMIAFSAVTIAFQLFFAGFITMRLRWSMDAIELMPAVLACGMVFICGALLSALPMRALPVAAVLVYAISITAFTQIGTDALQVLPPTDAGHSMLDLLCLAPTIVFGFLLCPYLDLTFHRALRESPSRHAFLIFGITFAVMIVMTVAYWPLRSEPLSQLFNGSLLAQQLLLAHLSAQLIFTVAVHMREMRIALFDVPLVKRAALQAAPIASVLLLAVAAALGWSYQVNESNYLRFLAFYGLIFPAYVLVFIGPWKAKALNPANLARLLIIIAALAPVYELGSIHGWSAMLVPAVALLLGVVWMTPRTAEPLQIAE